ncbi:MAG: 6-phosphogluconolactonase [Actinobacteria bacterium]|nr:6-phosphogluconolactonase [Actinomycetota bacterium]
MTFKIEVYSAAEHPSASAAVIAHHLPSSGSVILTGGTTAQRIYPELASAGLDWSGVQVGFSDERCVPPDDEASNFKMATDLLLNRVAPRSVLRMKGELDPAEGARDYNERIAPLAGDGFDLLLLGMGADAHVGAMFPGSPALGERELFAHAVDRPDGMKGITLTPPAMGAAKKILLLVTGEAKADTVRRAIQGGEPPGACPVRLLADHPDATFLLDEPAAGAL